MSRLCSFIKTSCVVVCALFIPVSVYAQNISPTNDSLFYYKIGGGRDISIPPQLDILTINFDFNGQASALNCNGFDPLVSIRSSLDNVRDGIDDAVVALETAATAAIANLPGYILQKANPGLYDLFQNALLRANEAFSLATKSCERIQYEISQGKNPYDEWVKVSWGDSWKRSIGAGGANIHDAKDEAEAAPENGLEWVGGIRRGGVGQAPIHVLADIASAGLNILSDRQPEVTANLPATAPLAEHFTGPHAVDEWVNDVLGDMQIGICATCNKGAKPCKGLIPYIESTTEEILASLTDLVSGTTPSTLDNLRHVDAPGIAITHQVIEAIAALPVYERVIVVNRLAQDIAETMVMEEAMIIRRLLLIGRKEGVISSNNIAQKEVEKALVELDSEIDNVIFEKEARATFLSNTVIELLLRDSAARQSSINAPAATVQDNRPLFQYGVKPWASVHDEGGLNTFLVHWLLSFWRRRF